MNAVRFSYSFVLFASCICGIVLIRYACKRRQMPGANYFIANAVLMVFYMATYMGEINSNTIKLAMFWFYLEHISIAILPYVWVLMGLDYIRAPRKILVAARYIMLYHPVLMLIAFYSNSINHLYISSYKFIYNGYFQVIVTHKTIIYYAINVISISMIGILCTSIYIYGYIKAIKPLRSGYIVMIIACMFPWFSVYLTATDMNYLGVDYFPVLTGITGILYMYSIFNCRIFRAIPIAVETVFNQSKEAILIIDLSGYIIDANIAFKRIYSDITGYLKKNKINTFIEKHLELIAIMEDKNKFEYEYYGVNYSAEIIPILAEENLEIGKILVITDISLFVEKQKRLELIATNAIDKAETNEIFFLQAQIKPHFINNTLSVISSMITRDPYAAKELIVSLSEYLANSYSTGNKSVMVSLNEEIELVNTYISIEKARFRERLNFQLLCNSDLNMKIPKLILQPLIENAIRHGILRKMEGGSVSLQITSKADRTCFKIEDDGVGIEESRIFNLLSGNDAKQGVGIYNVHKRLVRYYGEGLNLISNVGKGTIVEFSIPNEYMQKQDV